MLEQEEILRNYTWSKSIEQIIKDLGSLQTFAPGDEFREPLIQSLNELPSTDQTARLLEQFSNCIDLAAYLPGRVFCNLLVEAGIARIIHGPLPESMKEHISENGSAHRILVSGDFPDISLIPQVEIHHQEAVDFIFRNPRPGSYALADSYVPFSPDPSFPPEEQKKYLRNVLNSTQFLFVTKEFFYASIVRGSDLLQRIYGPKFWVMDAPLAGGLLYTDSAAVGFLEKPGMLLSNVIHEHGHTLFSETFHVKVKKLENSEPIFLDANVVLPDWFKEGVQNFGALRFSVNVDRTANFLDTFLKTWDGTIPKAQELIDGDTNIAYFLYTLFSSYVTQRLLEPSPFETRPVVDLTNVMRGFKYLRFISNLFEYELPTTPGDITQDFLKQLFDVTSQYLHNKFPKSASGMSFEQVCAEFDQNKMKYLENWIYIFATENQRAVYDATQITSDTSQALKKNRPQRRKKPIELKYKVTHDLELINDLKQSEKFLVASGALQDLQVSVKNHLHLARFLPQRVLYMILSEAALGRTLLEIPKEDLIQNHVAMFAAQRDLFEGYWLGADRETKARVHNRGGDPVRDLFDGQPFTGIVLSDNDFPPDIMRSVLLRHFDNLLSLTQQLHTDSHFPQKFIGRRTLLELYEMASGKSREDLFKLLRQTNFIFWSTAHYYDTVPLLAKLDHSMFWVREHPLIHTLLYTPRANVLQAIE